MQTTQGNSRAFQRVMKAMLELHRFFRIGFLDYVNNASHLDLNLPELQNAYTIILDEQFELRPDVFTVAKDAIEKTANELTFMGHELMKTVEARKSGDIESAQKYLMRANQILHNLVASYTDSIEHLNRLASSTKDDSIPVSETLFGILFLSADPTDASRLRLGEEFREIQEKLKLAKLRDRFRLEVPQLSVRPADITQALLDIQPQIVHFSGHGASTGALCFENQAGQMHFVESNALAALFEQFAERVNCVLLNACYSENQAKAISKHIDFVIGMNKAIGDKAAIAFAIGFYQALGAGRAIEEAYRLGCVQIRLQSIPEHLTPVLIKKQLIR